MHHPATSPSPRDRRCRLARIVGVALGSVLIAASCGGGDDDTADAGGVVVRDISVDTVDGSDIEPETTADGPTASSSSDDGDTASADAETDNESADTTTTLPQADETTPQQDLFAAIEVFQSCMTAEGIEFIGAPDASLGADAPQNQQPYIDSLILCATRSDIQNKIAAAQSAQADLSPEEVEEQNRTFLAFRDCMIGRGWTIPEPTPGDNGLLFQFAQTQEWEGPPGESLIDSDDVAECQDAAAVAGDS